MSSYRLYLWEDKNAGLDTCIFFFFQAEDGIRDYKVTGVQTCALPIWPGPVTGIFVVRATKLAVVQPDGGRLPPHGGKLVLKIATEALAADDKVGVKQIGRASCRERV